MQHVIAAALFCGLAAPDLTLARRHHEGTMMSLGKRSTNVGSGLNPTERALREAEEAVKAVREHRLHRADPAPLEAAAANTDEPVRRSLYRP